MWWTDMPAPSATHTHNHTGRFSLVQICSHDKYEFERIFYIFFRLFLARSQSIWIENDTTMAWANTQTLTSYKCLLDHWIMYPSHLFYAIDIVCYLFDLTKQQRSRVKREKYLRNNWTSRKCLGIKLSEVTADAVYRWLVCSTILSPSSAARSVSFGARFYCSINVWQRLSVSAHASNKRAEWTKCYFDCDFQLMWDARNRIENHLLSRTDRMNL